MVNAGAERLGIDPVRDISNLLVAGDGSEWLFMERGRFNANELQKKMIANGMAKTAYRGQTLLAGGTTGILFFKTVALEGTPAVLRRAIDIESAGKGEIPVELQSRLVTLSKQDQLWAVSRQGLAFANVPMNPDLESALSNITGSVSGTTAGLFVDSGLHLSADLQCVSDHGAIRVHDALRGIVAFGRLSTKDNEEDLLRAYDAIQVSKFGNVVKVRADINADLADKFIARFTSIRGSR